PPPTPSSAEKTPTSTPVAAAVRTVVRCGPLGSPPGSTSSRQLENRRNSPNATFRNSGGTCVANTAATDAAIIENAATGNATFQATRPLRAYMIVPETAVGTMISRLVACATGA